MKLPRKTVALALTEAQATPPTQAAQPIPTASLDLEPILTEPPPHRRAGHREAIPVAVKRAVWSRDAGRCSWPIDGGDTCGSTHRLQLDHVVPWAEWGGETEANLRLACAAHNRLAARQAFGERVMGRYLGAREPVAAYSANNRYSGGRRSASSRQPWIRSPTVLSPSLNSAPPPAMGGSG